MTTAIAAPPFDDLDRLRALLWWLLITRIRAVAAIDHKHVVEFTAAGYGLQHPLRCRADLIGCQVNRYLAGLHGPERPPGRYVLTLTPDEEKHGRWAAWYTPDDVALTSVGRTDG